MAKDDLSAVQQEAYLNVPSNLITLHTLELPHPSFVTPLRIVRDERVLNAKLEDNAPADPGTYQDFAPLYFQLTLPEIGSDPDPTLNMVVDNVGGILTPYLILAAASTNEIQVTYRSYVWNLVSEALSNGDLPSSTPLYMEVWEAIEQDVNVQFKITLVPIGNRPFPFNKYTPQLFPGLSV